MHVCTTIREGREWSSFYPTSLWSLDSNGEQGGDVIWEAFTDSHQCLAVRLEFAELKPATYQNQTFWTLKMCSCHIFIMSSKRAWKPDSLPFYTNEFLICNSLAFGPGCTSGGMKLSCFVPPFTKERARRLQWCSDNVLGCLTLLEIWEVRRWWKI